MIQRLWGRYKGLAAYTALNYLDKAFVLLVPLLVLWAFHDRGLYNQVEYIYSIGALAVVLIELGVRNYMLFGYREAGDRESFLRAGQDYFLLLNLLYSALVLLAGAFMSVSCSRSVLLVWVLGASRTLYNALFSFYSILTRLQDRPWRVFILSLSANIGTCLIMAGLWILERRLSLSVVFATQALLVVVFALLAVHRGVWRQIGALIPHLRKTLAYAWPIILNVLLVVAIQNVGKLYAQNALGSEDMTRIALAQRFALLVQLGHASAVGFLSKRFFLEKGIQMNRGLWVDYLAALGLGVVLSFMAAHLSGPLLGRGISPADPIFLLMMLFTVLWCWSAFLEQYLNRLDKNVWIPVINLAGAFVFCLVTLVLRKHGLMGIALGMVAFSIMSLAATLAVLAGFRKGVSHA